jgi:Kef-type K+ transport system membrane component KefB
VETLSNLAAIWIGVYVAVIAARYTRLTPVLFFLFVGAVMVNVGILPQQSDPFIRGFSEIGIIVIMFALGFEENTAVFMASVKRSWGIAFFGAVFPFFAAYVVAWEIWRDQNVALMCGLAMTATAVSLTMVSLRSEGLTATPAATRIMTSAVLDDIASLALVAMLVPIAAGERPANVVEIATIIFKAIGFFVVISIVGAWIFPHERTGWARRLLGTIGIRHFLSFQGGEYATLAVLLLAVGVGIIAHYFGFHPAVGAYMAGLILKEEYFHQDSETNVSSYHDTRRMVDNVAYSWIGPVFFVELGTKLVFDLDIFLACIPYTAALTIALLMAQVLSAALAAHYTGGMRRAGSIMVGIGMLGRAELAFVVMDIAYVQNPILNDEAFYTLMFTAFWLNVSVPILIRLWRPAYERELKTAA